MAAPKLPDVTVADAGIISEASQVGREWSPNKREPRRSRIYLNRKIAMPE
jgi:hypothetical protein